VTRFEDGPAKGTILQLHRAPFFLRVTESGGKFDALDQLEDTPRPDEKLHAYKAHGERGMCHIRASGGRSGFYAIATYKLVEPQPTDAQMRDNAAWSEWCHAQPEVMAQHPLGVEQELPRQDEET
jgi:hypothetical protein